MMKHVRLTKKEKFTIVAGIGADQSLGYNSCTPSSFASQAKKQPSLNLFQR